MNDMMNAMIAGGLLLLVSLALTPAASALAPVEDPTVPPQCDLDPSDGFIYCKSPVGRGCVFVQLWGPPKYCTG